MSREAIAREKDRIRELVWAALETAGAARPGVRGRIPNFDGAEQAAERLTHHPSWTQAENVKVVPDTAQLPARVRALAAGKHVYMAVPGLESELPYYDLGGVALPPQQAARSDVAAQYAPTIAVADMPPIDLVICGSVAVNTDGARLGKGAGYTDIELALLTEAGLLRPDTVIATTVHALQVLDQPLPEDAHDYGVDLIVTPDRIISCLPRIRPEGLIWNNLDAEKIAAIPALALLAGDRHPGRGDSSL